MNLTEALTVLNQSRQNFLAAIADLDETQISQIPVEGVWTVKDLLGHLTAWEAVALPPLRAYAAGGNFAPEIVADHNLWNAGQAQRRAAWPLAQVMDEYRSVRNEFVALLAQVPEDRWQKPVPVPWGGEANMGDLAGGLAWHENEEHLKSIVYWKETGKPR